MADDWTLPKICIVTEWKSTCREGTFLYRLGLSNCERSELLIWQVHQFGLGCIKLSTSRGYEEVPKWYSDWSMCTVFDTPGPKLMSLLPYKGVLS